MRGEIAVALGAPEGALVGRRVLNATGYRLVGCDHHGTL